MKKKRKGYKMMPTERGPVVWLDENGYVSYDSRLVRYLRQWLSYEEAQLFLVPFTPQRAVAFGQFVWTKLYPEHCHTWESLTRP